MDVISSILLSIFHQHRQSAYSRIKPVQDVYKRQSFPRTRRVKDPIIVIFHFMFIDLLPHIINSVTNFPAIRNTISKLFEVCQNHGSGD